MSIHDDSLLPDYYAVLQVHPEADNEIIRAAYRLLMRKYHPDSLPEAQRDDLELLKRVRLINQAYDVLGDPEQRAAYDQALRQRLSKPAMAAIPGINTRIHLVRCAKSHATYKMLLAKPAGSKGLYRVTGFELLESAPDANTNSPAAPTLALPERIEQTTPVQKFLNFFAKRKVEQPGSQNPPPVFPSESELLEMFDDSHSLDFGQINWAGFNCPDCHTDFQLPSGTSSQWCRCSRCSRIYCTGNLITTPLGATGRCPWCGRIARITRTIQPGQNEDLRVKGEVWRSEQDSSRLHSGDHPRLPQK